MNERKDVIGCMEIAIGMGLGMLFCLLITLCGCKPQQEIVGYQRDSIQVPVETEKIREKVITKIEKVEKPLKWWQKIFIGIGGFSLIVICLGVAWSIGKRKG